MLQQAGWRNEADAHLKRIEAEQGFRRLRADDEDILDTFLTTEAKVVQPEYGTALCDAHLESARHLLYKDRNQAKLIWRRGINAAVRGDAGAVDRFVGEYAYSADPTSHPIRENLALLKTVAALSFRQGKWRDDALAQVRVYSGGMFEMWRNRDQFAEATLHGVLTAMYLQTLVFSSCGDTRLDSCLPTLEKVRKKARISPMADGLRDLGPHLRFEVISTATFRPHRTIVLEKLLKRRNTERIVDLYELFRSLLF